VPTRGGNNLVGPPIGPFDQSTLEDRNDVLVYTTAPLAEPIEVTGPVKMILYAASTARDTDFTAKLIDVYPDGKAYNLCDGIIRARYRESRTAPELIEPGRVYRYEIDLWVTSNLFKTGHRIGLEVSSSNFPRFDRNPNSGKPFGTDTELLSATQTIHHSQPSLSHLLLPVIPPRPDVSRPTLSSNPSAQRPSPAEK
jgi:putative CocE/NonD family hydrolase